MRQYHARLDPERAKRYPNNYSCFVGKPKDGWNILLSEMVGTEGGGFARLTENISVSNKQPLS